MNAKRGETRKSSDLGSEQLSPIRLKIRLTGLFVSLVKYNCVGDEPDDVVISFFYSVVPKHL